MAVDFGADEASKYGGGGASDRFKFVKGDNRIRVLEIAQGMLATHFVDEKPILCIGIKEGCRYHGDGAPTKKNAKGEAVPVKPSIKKLMYVYVVSQGKDAVGKVMMMFAPYTVVKALQDLATDPEWSFEAFPMPYDVTIKYDKDAAPVNMYKVIGSPARTEIAGDVMEQLNAMPKLADIMEKMKSKGEAVPPPDDEPGVDIADAGSVA